MPYLTKDGAIVYLRSQLDNVIEELRVTEKHSEHWRSLEEQYKAITQSILDMLEFTGTVL